MTRYSDMDALRRNISPDVRIVDDGHAPAYRLTEAKPAPSEHDEQCAVFAWATENEAAHPELAMLFAIPNGGARHPAVAAQMKAEGVRAGVPDMFLAVRRGTAGGLFIEMKRRPNKTTPEQNAWIDNLRWYGYAAVICWSAQEAQQTIMAYLSQAVQP